MPKVAAAFAQAVIACQVMLQLLLTGECCFADFSYDTS